MAKDGTHRGGRRAGAGRKPKSLAEKPSEGKSVTATESQYPKPSEYLSQLQRDGSPLGADEIYTETAEWLKKRGCSTLVNPRLIESYSQAFARYIQCEDAISRYGLLGKHPTTNAPIASPFVAMAQSYQKQANLIWYEIFSIVKENCSQADEQDDLMEKLLRKKSEKL